MRSSISGLVAGIIGSRILASQWSHISAQPPAVIEKTGKLLLAQPLSSEEVQSLKIGLETKTGVGGEADAMKISSFMAGSCATDPGSPEFARGGRISPASPGWGGQINNWKRCFLTGAGIYLYIFKCDNVKRRS